MPAGQPFTALCQLAARGPSAGRVDLHVHTTYSDGVYTPAQVVDLARRAGLAALAVTDHDTLGGVPAARTAAAGSGVEIVSGVEITAEYRQRELHLLGYFVALDHAGLTAALEDIRHHRRERFREMIERLRGRGVSLEEQHVRGAPEALGRRHLAEMLVRARRVATVREAFMRYLGDRGGVAVPKKRLPVGEALALVGAAGGVAAWAHPPYDGTQEQLAELQALGLRAVEIEYPDVRRSRCLELRGWAERLGLAVTGGSDCHGPGRRGVGCCTISADEFAQLAACRLARTRSPEWERDMRNEFTAVIEQDSDWYIGYCPEIPGANGQGRTIEECRASLADAIALILQDRREEGMRGVPSDAICETVTLG